MNTTRLPRDCDAWTTVDARLDGAPPSHIVCDTCSEWVHVHDVSPDICPNTCSDCVRRMDDEMDAFLASTPFPPTPDPVALACPLDDHQGAGVGSPPSGASLDRTTRLVGHYLAHPATGVVLGAALVVLSTVSSALVLALGSAR